MATFTVEITPDSSNGTIAHAVGKFSGGSSSYKGQRRMDVAVNGTVYEVKGGKCMVGGTVYSIKKGRTLIAGTGYAVKFQNGYTWILNENADLYSLQGANPIEYVDFTSNGERFIGVGVQA